MSTSLRLDVRLVQEGYFESREKARYAISSGCIRVSGHIITKPAYSISVEAPIEILDIALPYVSRGGLKLEKAIREFNLDFTDKTVLDVGASTGGFSDCALQHGAKQVIAIDVGVDQLHPSLRTHPQVLFFEKTDFRHLPERVLNHAPFDIVLADLSFISLQGLFPIFHPFVKPEGFLLVLVKPQFELKTRIRLKNGILKDESVRQKILKEIIDSAENAGLNFQRTCQTDADGASKNIEYFILFTKKNAHQLLL